MYRLTYMITYKFYYMFYIITYYVFILYTHISQVILNTFEHYDTFIGKFIFFLCQEVFKRLTSDMVL